jgi:hypothetical protein
VIEARHYAAAKRIVESNPATLPDTPLVQLAQTIELELVDEQRRNGEAPDN